MLWSNFSACFTVVHMKWLKGPETSQSQWSFVPSCVCISCVCDCVVCVLVCAPVQDVFKGCGGVPSEPMWAPPAGRRYSVIRPIDSTRAQKRRKCGAAVFGALFLTHPPSPPSDRCLLKWTLKTYLIIWVTPVLTLPANDCFARKINRRCVSKPFLLDEFSFVKDVISTCFKSSRWPTAQKFV